MDCDDLHTLGWAPAQSNSPIWSLTVSSRGPPWTWPSSSQEQTCGSFDQGWWHRHWRAGDLGVACYLCSTCAGWVTMHCWGGEPTPDRIWKVFQRLQVRARGPSRTAGCSGSSLRLLCLSRKPTESWATSGSSRLCQRNPGLWAKEGNQGPRLG